MMKGVGVRAAPVAGSCPIAKGCKSGTRLPPRSMAGQLTLDQHIGVRIPGGQPLRINNLRLTYARMEALN